LKLDEYEQFWKLLEQPDYTIVDALGEVTSERDEVAKNLVRLFQAKSKSIPLLIHLTAQEVKNTPTSDVLFRGNSIATKAVDAFMKLIGGNFLRKTIGKKVREIIASKRSCEVDPTKLEKGENIEENQKHLVDIVKSVSDVIFASAEATPIEFRLVFTELQKYVLEKFGEKDNTRYTAVSGFIFLRFWGPAVLGPKLFGLTDEHPGLVAGRTLTLVSKVLQTLGNLATFGGKEPYMEFMNKYIETHQAPLKQYLYTISYNPSSAAPTQLDHVIDVEAEMAGVYYHLQREKQKVFAVEKKSPALEELPAVLNNLEQKYSQYNKPNSP